MSELPALFVAEHVRSRLLALAARPWEVGGWLLGYWTEDRRAVAVTHATPPVGRGTPWGVWIGARGHRERFDEAWEASGGIITFVGDWHSHPGGPAVPSARDQGAARQLAEEPDYRTPRPVIAIASHPRLPGGHGLREVEWYVGTESDGLRRGEPRALRRLPAIAEAVPGWRWRRAHRARSE